MNTVSREQITEKREQAALNSAAMRAAIGARANCDPGGCFILQRGGSCPKTGGGECPAGANEITAAQVSKAVLDGSIDTIFANSHGGFSTFSKKDKESQTPTSPVKVKVQPKPQPKTNALAQRSLVINNKSINPEQIRGNDVSNLPGFLGEIAVMVFGGSNTVPAKK